jgi:CheY-like chemotaxis protein
MALILIIEDNSYFREMLRKMFESEGYDVVEAVDGIEGIRSYRERKPDVTITDLIMPNKEGIETIQELVKEFPEAKIIAMSGGGISEAEPYLLAAKMVGAKCAFTKPIESEKMLEAVRELLK